MLSRLSSWLSTFRSTPASSYRQKIGLPFVLLNSPAIFSEEEKISENEIPDEIVPSLFIGNRDYADNYLREKEQKANENTDYVVLRCTPHLLPIEIPREKLQRGDLLKIVHFYDSATPPSTRDFNHCFDFIDTAIQTGKKVLVVCENGSSYSPAIVSAYLVRKYGLTNQEAMNHVKSKRRCDETKCTAELKQYEDAPSYHKTIRNFLAAHELSYQSGFFNRTHLKAYKNDKHDLDDGVDIDKIFAHARKKTFFGNKNRTRLELEKMKIMNEDGDVICHRNCKSNNVS